MQSLPSASPSSGSEAAPQCCCSVALGMQRYWRYCGGRWQLSEWKPQLPTERVPGATAQPPWFTAPLSVSPAGPMVFQVMLSVLQMAAQGGKRQKPVALTHPAAAEIPTHISLLSLGAVQERVNGVVGLPISKLRNGKLVCIKRVLLLFLNVLLLFSPLQTSWTFKIKLSIVLLYAGGRMGLWASASQPVVLAVCSYFRI